MQAIVMRETGGPEVLGLELISDPEIVTPTQIKVEIKAAGANPIDTKLRSRGVFIPDGLPAVLGCDGAGIVVETGSEVSAFREGDEVWFCQGGLGGLQGNYAEYIVIEELDCCRKPASIDFAHAAAAPLVLITAWEALFGRAQLAEGQTLLVHAGAGGVGHVAIQLAKQMGARVVTTVSSPKKAEFVRSLGADAVINYRETDFAEEVMRLTEGNGADVVLDTVGAEVFSASIPVTAHYGDLVTLLDPGADIDWKEARTRNLRIGFTLMLTPMLRELPQARADQVAILSNCSEFIDSGSIKISLSDSLPLTQAATAHRMVEEGHTQGKIVLIP
ncbi:MAG: zinc-dependent alcohol dehydrogenase family protein [Candidatus Thiodiazotropha sp. (ex Gloverina cf. vestifex)]|nr:zinc-dependent alcohol dehydrogenase family protein [Candidatus Thiodiazotropha sp. (ex Gloverina cf. vestifex)]